MKEVISTDKAPAAIGPYSQAIRSEGLVFVSGQLPIDPVTGQMPAATDEQARQALTNVRAILEKAGTSMDRVLRVGVFMTDLAEFKPVNEVYSTFFTGECPARATVQVAALPLGAKIEIEAVAEVRLTPPSF